DEARHQVQLDGHLLDLSPREFDLLRFLVRHPQQVFSRQVILDRVWGADFLGGEGNVDVCIASLRSKLGPEHRAMLQTVRSVGFRLSPGAGSDGECDEAGRACSCGWPDSWSGC